MIRKLLAFFVVSLFILLSATFARGAKDVISLQVEVATNIHSYFKNGKFTAETNGPDNLIVREGQNSKGESQYTIVPEL